MGKNVHNSIHKKGQTTASLSCCEGVFASGIQRLRQGLYFGQYEPVQNLFDIDGLEEVLLYIQEMQMCLAALARGNISKPVPLKGYTADLLKEMQENLHQIIWKARQLTVGDFSCNVGCMGEISEAFEVMGRTLQSALVRLEQQKQDLTELSENLRREIDARAAIEEDLRREQAQLQKLASTDPLTGIANRRHFFQTALRELERLRRSGGDVCLAMLDIDHFKDLNDSLGHSAGDKALRRIARIITSIVRPYDIVGRYGGDEFVFLFSEVTRDKAHTLLERLRNAVEKAKISAGRGNPAITVSIGLTCLNIGTAASSSKALDKAIMRADKALYKAKQESRNHIYII